MCLCLFPRFRVRSLLSLLVVCGLLLSYQRGFCDPLDTPVQDGSGAVWANHDSDDGAYKQLSFQSILGVGYRIEKSNNLVNWTNFAQFYGVGNTVTWNLFANPVPEDQNGGGNQAPVEEDTRKSATLVMNKADTGELVLGWTSLDTAEAVQYALTGLSIADEWNTNPIVGHSTDDYHFTMLLMTRYNGVIPQNSQLGALDTAMIADFSSNFATINQSVIDNAAASQLAPPPLPPDPSSKVFFRLAVNAKLDSDFDGIPDVLEYQNGNSSSFSHDSDGDGFSDGAENDQGTNPNDANDKPEIEALIVTGNAEAGVEISQKRKIIIPAGSPNRLIVVALQSDEYPSYTSGDLCEGECPFNDQLRWLITLSNGETISGQVDVNDLHEKWETESDTFLGRSPVYFQEVKVVESKPDQDVVVEVEVGATNIEDGALPSTVMVGLLPVDLTVAKAKLTLLEENTLKVEGADKFPDGLLDGVKFEIKRDGEATWYEIQDGAAIEFKGKARVAGKFKVRATLDLDGKEVQTEEEAIEVCFPTANEILAGNGVKARMDQAWQNTIQNTADNSRREEGYYITLDTKTETWGIAGYTVGNVIKDNQGPPRVDGLGAAKPDDIPKNPKPLDQPRYTVGWFHTHTPEFYRNAVDDFGDPPGTIRARDAGPSQGDKDFAANTVELPGFVYDYVGVQIANFQDQVPFGHPLNAPAKITEITPPQKRKTP